ncbi:MAG: anthranilate synthase component I [Pseudomonadota bacterium]
MLSSGASTLRRTLTPIRRTVLADMETPLSTYRKLADGPNTYLLESVQGGETWGRYSIIGLPCREVVRVHGREVERLVDGEVVQRETVADPLAWVADQLDAVTVADCPDLPRFFGGFVGYFGYDSVRYIERKLDTWHQDDPLGTPDIALMVSDAVVVFDNLRGTLSIVLMVDADDASAVSAAEGRLDAIEAQIRAPAPPLPAQTPRAVGESDFSSQFTEAGYLEGVERCKAYIEAGDCMQVVLSQRMTADITASPLDLYRALRILNPSPYLYFLDFGDHQVVGSSPEILVREEGGQVSVRPLAGTRKRGATAEEDRALEVELLADPKEIAEHLMLIDLGRNDIGRIAEIGSVEVSDEMTVERYSHVMHIVSHVTGTARAGLTPLDVLRATFPAGTLSGAPKVRAMEILDEIEPVKRGVYGGAVGYIGWGGNMDMAIAIRTAVVKDGTLTLLAGAGVVYDSVPALEWEETLNKGRAVFRALALAERGLDMGVQS